MTHGLPVTAVKGIKAVLARHPQVYRAVLYGSRAKGNYKTGSDIDLTLFGSEELSMNVVFKILNELDELALPYMIDLSIYQEISDPDLKEHIERVGVLFFENLAHKLSPQFVQQVDPG